MPDDFELSGPEDAPLPVTPCRETVARHHIERTGLPLGSVEIAMATIRYIHGTWPANRAHADRELWYYAARAIANDY